MFSERVAFRIKLLEPRANRSNIVVLINCHMSTRVNRPNLIGPASAITRHAACQNDAYNVEPNTPDVNRGSHWKAWYLIDRGAMIEA